MATIEHVRKGLEIFGKLKGPRSHSVNAGHEIFYGPEGGQDVQSDEDGEFISCEPPYDKDMQKLTAGDRKKLLSWGWFIDEVSGHWAIHT